MRKLLPLFLSVAFFGLLFTFLHLPAHRSPAAAASGGVAAKSGAGSGGPSIQSTNRISIPYGITGTLPLRDRGNGVLVGGHGGCTPGEIVTVVVTVTQPYGATAVGQTEQTCTGELQRWQLPATTITSVRLQAGPAEACGLATTRDAGEVTATFDWCRADPATLAWFNYLPIMVKQHPAVSADS
ncbi:MAG: hypothetical protein R3272_09810 [Candidatus Promineifilaceae bacterium]|nr:hypothetical protein [Candidatus Promineifilaceae bacterium]